MPCPSQHIPDPHHTAGREAARQQIAAWWERKSVVPACPVSEAGKAARWRAGYQDEIQHIRQALRDLGWRV